MTAVDHKISSEENAAHGDLASAKRTYQSIVQVLYSSRNLEISRRKNLDTIRIGEILPMLKEKTGNSQILLEAKAIESLFAILQNNYNRLTFVPPASGVITFDRYVLLKRLFAFGTDVQKNDGNVLLQKYAVAFLRKVQNEELRIDQISVLNNEIAKLPKNEFSHEFLTRVKSLFAPDIANILGEKIENIF